MIKIGLNGLGRIGRAIFRLVAGFEDIEIVAVNDINPEIDNMVYLLKFDSYYGRFGQDLRAEDDCIKFNGHTISVSHEKNISDVRWEKMGCDVVIDAAGTHHNLKFLPVLLQRGVKKVIVTYSPDEVDHTIVLGANEDTYDGSKHHIISSSICDSIAFAPIYKIMNDRFGIEGGFLTTLHPWLSYQNLLDGPSTSWGWPGTIYSQYAVGRASTASLIPKPTSAIQAVNKVLPGVLDKMKCYSFRVPTPVVGAADITFHLSSDATQQDLMDTFAQFEQKQKWPIIHINEEHLVSVDLAGTDYSAVLDTRWIAIVNKRLVNLTLWYDNEWGYSRRVVDVVRFIFDLKPQKVANEANTLP